MKQALKWIFAILFLAAFVALSFAVRTVDVAEYPIGEGTRTIGLYQINSKVFNTLGGQYKDMYYKIATWLGYACLAMVGVFALAGFVQMISRRSLLKVDKTIFCLAALYIVTLALYFVFEKIVINYRPLLIPGTTEPAASFPSSHTMLAVVMMGSTMLVLGEYIRKDALRVIVWVLCLLVMLATVCCRLLSCVHWATDILAGALLGVSLLLFFSAVRHCALQDIGKA